MGCSPTGSFVHGILQAKILECVAIPFSRGSSQPRDWTWVSCTVGRFFAIWATGEAGIKEAGESYLNASFPKWPRSSTTNSKGSVGSLHFKISLFIATRSENCPFTHSGGHLLSCLICSHGASFLDMKTPDPPNLAHWHNTGQSNSSWAPLRLRGVGELKKKKKKSPQNPPPERSRKFQVPILLRPYLRFFGSYLKDFCLHHLIISWFCWY